MTRVKLPTRTTTKTTEIIRRVPKVERLVNTTVPAAGATSIVGMTERGVRAYEAETQALFDQMTATKGAPKSIISIGDAELQTLMPPPRPRKLGRMLLNGVTQFFRSLAEPFANMAQNFATGNQFGLFFPPWETGDKGKKDDAQQGTGSGRKNDFGAFIARCREVATQFAELHSSYQTYRFQLARIIGEQFNGSAHAITSERFLEESYRVGGVQLTGAQLISRTLELQTSFTMTEGDAELTERIQMGGLELEHFDHHGGLEEMITAIVPGIPPQDLSDVFQQQAIDRVEKQMRDYRLILSEVRTLILAAQKVTQGELTLEAFDKYLVEQTEAGLRTDYFMKTHQHFHLFGAKNFARAILFEYLETQYKVFNPIGYQEYLRREKLANEAGESINPVDIFRMSDEAVFQQLLIEAGIKERAEPKGEDIKALQKSDVGGALAFQTEQEALDALSVVLHMYFDYGSTEATYLDALESGFLPKGYIATPHGSTATGWDIVSALAHHQAIGRSLSRHMANEPDPDFPWTPEKAVVAAGGPRKVLEYYIYSPDFLSRLHYRLDMERAQHQAKHRGIELAHRLANILRQDFNQDLDRLRTTEFLDAEYVFQENDYTGRELLALREELRYTEIGRYAGHLRSYPDAIISIVGLDVVIQSLAEDPVIINARRPEVDVETMVTTWQELYAQIAGGDDVDLSIPPSEVIEMTTMSLGSEYSLPKTNRLEDLLSPAFLEDRMIFTYSSSETNVTGRDVLRLWAFTMIHDEAGTRWDEIKGMPLNDAALRAVEMMGGLESVQEQFAQAANPYRIE